MAVTQRVKAAAPVVDRLLKDRQVQDQLVDAGDHLQQVYRRVSRRKAKAAEDKKVYAHVRKGVVALRKAGTTATEPRRRPWRKVLALAVVAGGAAVVYGNQGARAKVKNAVGGTTSSADGAGSSPQTAATPA
jgi:ABC-type hemin transport system substrate-binding protein